MSTENEELETTQEEAGAVSNVDNNDEFPDPLVGKTVAHRYKVLKKMGEGGMGTVYLAEHITIEKKVALKVLLQEYARKQDLKERFLREAKAAASIGHENIIDITDFGDTPDGSVFFAMEFLDGADLSHAIKADGPIEWARAKPILLQICRALGAAHSKSIIHRDMKPENIYLIEREGRPDFVKVLDFGIAKVSGLNDGESRLTRTGMIFGTPEYMSPEQAQGHHPDHRVDIYAVGVIMYELLTGDVPFKADTFMGILTKHIFEQPIAPSQVKPDLAIPVEAEHVIMKAMAKDRDERFGSMTEMAAAIQQVSGRLTRSTSDIAVARVMTGSVPTPGVTRATGRGSGRVAQPIDTIAPAGMGGAKKKILAVGAIALVLAGGAIAASFAVGGGDKKPPPVTKPNPGTKTVVPAVTKKVPPKPETVTVLLQTKPAGAQVFQGEKRIGGLTPTNVSLTKSKRKVLFTFKLEGYEERKETIVPDGSSEKHTVELTKKAVAVTKPRVRRPRRPRRPTVTKPKPKVQPAKKPPTKKANDPQPRRIPSELRDPFAS